MHQVRTPSAGQANHPFVSSRNNVALNEHVPHSTCSAVASQHQKSFGTVASATVEANESERVQTHRKSATPQLEEQGGDRESRRLRFELKKQAGALYRKHVSLYKNPFDQCMSQYLGYVEGGQKATHATIVHDKTHGTAYVKNIHQCHNAWACPVCSEKNSREREAEILQLEEFCQANGYFMAMATLTIRHKKSDKVAILIDDMLKSVRAFWSGKWATKFKKNWGFIGHVRSLEVTYSDTNGFHPHLHYLLILKDRPTDLQLEHLQDVFFERWSEVCEKQGNEVSPAGFCLEAAERGTYVSKWGVSAELTKHQYKNDSKTMNMWSLLASSVDNDSHGKKWIEFMNAVRRRAQIMWSPGLKGLVEEFISQQESDQKNDEQVELDEVDIPERFIRPLLNAYGQTWLGVFEDVEKRGLKPIRDWLQIQLDIESSRFYDDDDICF